MSSESQIRQLIDTWLKSVLSRNIDGIVAPYAEDITAFDAVKALQFKGKAAYRAHWEACMAMCPGPGVFEIHELHIVAAAEVAFAHWLVRCGPGGEEGQSSACWMRVSAGYQQHHGQWQVQHEHWSAPFDMESGKALFDLTP